MSFQIYSLINKHETNIFGVNFVMDLQYLESFTHFFRVKMWWLILLSVEETNNETQIIAREMYV